MSHPLSLHCHDSEPIAYVLRAFLRATLMPLAVIGVCFGAAPAAADDRQKAKSNWSHYGDVRFRHESDFNSRRKNGDAQQARDRWRIRTRLGVKYTPNDVWTFDARLRTGSNNSQQSPNITFLDFQGNDTGDAHVNFDRFYVKAANQTGWFWVGRNDIPFWGTDRIFWSTDVTVPGVTAGTSFKIDDNRTIKPIAGVYALPVGLRHTSGYMAAAQMVYSHTYNGVTYEAAPGYFGIMADSSDDQAHRLADGNGYRDYKILTLNTKASWMHRGVPLQLRVEYMKNVEPYSANASDPYTARYRNHTNGYVISAQAGDTLKKGNWMFAYTFAHIKALALSSSYSQDEWTRWNADYGQSRPNDLQGHQIGIGYALSDVSNIIVRGYVVDAISTRENNDRIRLDWNYRF